MSSHSRFLGYVLVGFLGAVAPSGSAKPESPPSGQYRLDAKRSRFGVDAEAGGVFSVFGHDHHIQVRDFSGTASLGPGSSLDGASLEMSVRADSLAVTDDVSAKDRAEIESTMKGKVLETAKYPKISFKSSQVTTTTTTTTKGDASSQVRISGTLSLHGVNRKVSIPAHITLKGNSLRATGKLKLLQTDYGMTPITAVAGTVRVKDEVTLSFDIVATR